MTQHPPSARRLQRARAQGDVPYSRALTRAAAVVAVAGWVGWSAPRWMARWREGVAGALSGSGGSGGGSADAAAWVEWLGWATWQGVALVAVVAAVGVAVGVAQVGVGVRSPAGKSHRRGLIGAVALGVGWVVMGAVACAWALGALGAGWVLGAASAVGLSDAALTRWLRWRRLHMTTAEVRAEAREGEPPPTIRQRLRQAAHEDR